MNDFQKIGVTLTAISVLFYTLGVVLLFDKGLIALASVLFTSSLFLILGLNRAVRFFFVRRKWRASGCFFGGFALVLLGWPALGTLVQAVGALQLFFSFLPIALTFLRQVPGLGPLLETGWMRRALQRLSAAASEGYAGSGSSADLNGFGGAGPKLPV
ncbi:hypothetical protein CDCA_CDCA01G0110 [Cyanidium caldarium]|uniref:Vesicle transport protein GOT1B n=1 Tax=Cyanidium caldarium TaxID=2771 RepID=A0AAV9IPR2_CYACA|nr:hypothetical protein CDCA_CDCA01G0110 [Cyanidium caldarium]